MPLPARAAGSGRHEHRRHNVVGGRDDGLQCVRGGRHAGHSGRIKQLGQRSQYPQAD